MDSMTKIRLQSAAEGRKRGGLLAGEDRLLDGGETRETRREDLRSKYQKRVMEIDRGNEDRDRKGGKREKEEK